MLSPGTNLELRQHTWTVVGPLPGGSGGFGKVYVVNDEEGNEAVAKVVLNDPGADRELLIGAAIRAAEYRNVVTVLDDGDHGDDLVLVMPRAERSLASYLAAHTSLSVDVVIPILRDVATALADIHGEIVHRDLKPQNILLLDGSWHLADFGISRYAEATTAADTRKYMMTPPYAAPEQWRAEHATEATDVYALGVIAYELLSGELPFPGPDYADFREQHLNDAPPPLTAGTMRLRDLIDECLVKAPEARPRPAAILQRLDKITDEPAIAGFKKLAEVNREEVSRWSAELRQASVEQERRERRHRLHDSAVALFAPIGNRLLEAIESYAPIARIELEPAHYGRTFPASAGKLFLATLGGAQLGLDKPALSTSTWTSPFMVISESVITVTMSNLVRGWGGRSHSLWFCNAQQEDRFAWYELAFTERASVPPVVPFQLSAADTQFVFESGIGTTQVAWPLEEIDRSDPSAFIGRWLEWFADAAAGRLQRPMMLPERSAEGSWRQAGR